MDRAKAEEDPSYKQLIPYVLFRYKGQYLSYTRGASGGESRLHAKMSLGIGGHINPIDNKEGQRDHATYMAGVAREIEEEISLQGPIEHQIVGLLNDDSNEVGKVHLGVIHLVELHSEEISPGEAAISNLTFHSKETLQGALYDQLESWSQYCAKHLDYL